MTWPNPFVMEQVSKLGKDKWNAYRWHIQEHSGTHLDAPLHCTGVGARDLIPADQLVGPLVVVDIRAGGSDRRRMLNSRPMTLRPGNSAWAHTFWRRGRPVQRVGDARERCPQVLRFG